MDVKLMSFADGWVPIQRALVLPDIGLFEQVCLPVWLLGVSTIVTGGLVSLLFWALISRVRMLHAQLDQSAEDAASLSELFSSELERLRVQLSQSKEDSDSLDEILGSILKGGLPGHLEMVSKDYWCVKTMDVTYIDQEGKRRTWRQSGYHVNCFIPGGAQDIEVTFSVVGGAECKQVDRTKSTFPYVYDETGHTKPEKFVYARCPGNVRFELRGPSLAAFVSHVTEVHGPPKEEVKEPGSPAVVKGRPVSPPPSGRNCS